jgi:hypothetical protein
LFIGVAGYFAIRLIRSGFRRMREAGSSLSRSGRSEG